MSQLLLLKKSFLFMLIIFFKFANLNLIIKLETLEECKDISDLNLFLKHLNYPVTQYKNFKLNLDNKHEKNSKDLTLKRYLKSLESESDFEECPKTQEINTEKNIIFDNNNIQDFCVIIENSNTNNIQNLSRSYDYKNTYLILILIVCLFLILFLIYVTFRTLKLSHYY